MFDRLFVLRAAMFVIACSSFGSVQADDCFRRFGFGYSAGYHAPVACPTPSCHQKLDAWHGWKQACTLPNARTIGGDCGCAPCAPALPCLPCAPCFSLPKCGGCFMPGGCGPCAGPVVQPSRAALMFN